MRRDSPRWVGEAVVLTLLFTGFASPLRPATADPWVSDNGDGTSTAVWNFTNPADYALANVDISGGTASLAPQTTWWNSTTAADFAGPDGETNIDRATWPGDVALGATAGPTTLLTLQPGATGVDTWLDRNNQATNYGAATTMVLDGRNPQGHPLLRFDLSAIPAGAVIDDAILSLYQSAGLGNQLTANVRQVTAAWAEMQATWDDRMTAVAWTNPGGDYSTHVVDVRVLDNAAGWRTWNVTALVDLWYRGRLTNNGLIVEAPNPGVDSDKTFYSSDYNVDPTRRPKIDIRYRVLGATGEYVSRVGGPGTTALWQTISWNPSVRSLVSDEFSGSGLDPKWTWTNPPASFDVNTTTPGHLRVTSSTGVDFNGGTFTGNVLANDVVGDFTATMKFNANPTASGQKAGLMVLVEGRDWYQVVKTNVFGAVNWRVRATEDAVTTNRVDVASGNPVPAWVRIQRAGTTFTASTSTDGTAWTVRDAYTPTVEYPLSVRIAPAFADGLSGTAHVVDVDYVRVDLGNDATASVATRTGDVTPVDGTWSGWSAPYPTPAGSMMAGSARYVEYRLSLAVTYPDHRPVVGDVNLSWSRYAPSGTVETGDLVPADVAAWGTLSAVHALNGQIIAYEYSLDGGGIWTPVAPPADLSAVSVATGRIRVRASLSTADTLVSPSLSEIRLTYAHRLDHFDVMASASAAAGAPFTVTVTAKDAANATMASWTGTVTLAARLLDGVTPGGGVLGTTSLAIAAGGSATLATETYTVAEVIRIHASFASAEGLSGPVAISPGPVTRVVVAPDNVTLLPFDTQGFAGQAFDAYDNPVPGASFNWTVVGGVGTLNVSAGPSVLFTASPPPANGTLEMAFGAVSATAAIRVVSGVPPWVVIGAPAPGAHLTGAVPIAYTNSSDAVLVTFEYDAGAGWTVIGSTAPNGTYVWDTSALDFVGGSLRATVENNKTITNTTVVSPIEVDNTPPAITLGTITDDQAGSGTITVAYATDADVVRVDFTYFDGAWTAIGADLTVDGSYVWTPGAPINGVTLRAVAVDDVNLTGFDERSGVGNYTTGTSPPAIAAIPDLYVRTGLLHSLNLTFYVSDPDTPLAALAVSVSDPANVTANAGAYPSLDITYAAAGTYDVTLWVSDGTDTAWAIVRVFASAQSPPAPSAALPAVAFDEDTTAFGALGAPATAFFWDPDGDPLTFTILDNASVRARVNGNDTVDLWAPADWFGFELLRIRATDPTGGFAEAAFPVTVRPVNDAPVLVSAFPAVAFDEDTTATDALGGNVTVRFSDVDLDSLTIAVLGGANVSARVNPGDTVDLWAAANWSGSETLRVRATDPSGAYAEGTVSVLVRPVNDAPVALAVLPSVAFDEDTIAADVLLGPASLRFQDPDGDVLAFAVFGAVQVAARLNADLTLDLWAAANWSGSETLRLRAVDSGGAFGEGAFSVLVRPVNDPPQFAPVAPVAMGQSETRTLDLAPYVSDIDNDASSLVVTTDSPYVRVNGLVLTMAFPSDWTEANLTVTVSDGGGAASQPLRVTILSPGWKLPLMVVSPFALAVVVGVFVRRTRFRPVKAFLVSEDKRLIREFTLDPGCEVTFEQALGAGALDAVETPVKVAKYHAQTVKGDALAVTLLAYGPVSPEQIEFAREMLVNIQAKFEDGVKERHASVAAREEALTASIAAHEHAVTQETTQRAAAIAAEDAQREQSLAAVNVQLEAERQAISKRSRAITDLVDTTTAARTRIAEEARAQHAQAEDLARRESRVAEDAARTEARATETEAERAAFEAWRSQAEDEARRTRETLDAHGTALAEQQAALVRGIEEFEGTRAQKMEFIASKEVELEAKEHALGEKAEAVRAQSQANGRQLSDLAAREEALEVEGSRWDKVRQEAEVRRAQVDELAKSVDARAAAVREEEARKAEEFRQWHASLESQDAVLREQRAAFEKEMAEVREGAARTRAELEGREAALSEREAKSRADVEYATHMEAEVKRRDEAAQLALRQATALTAQADAARADAARMDAEVEARERAFKEESERSASDVSRREAAVMAAESELADRKAALEREFGEREAGLRDADAEVSRRIESAEEKAGLLLSREASLAELETSLERDRVDLQERVARLQAREVDVQQTVQRYEEESARFREESEAAKQSIASREAAMKAEQERIERESRSLQDTLGTKAEELARRERELADREADARSRVEALETREREITYRERQASDQIRELSAKSATLDQRTKDLDARGAQLEAAAGKFALEEEEKRRQWAEVEESFRSQEDRARSEVDTLNAQVHLRGVDLDRRERELADAAARMQAERASHEELLRASTAKKADAEAAAERAEERLAELNMQESELLRAREGFEAERAAWEPKRAEELRQLELTRQAAAEQTMQAERALQDARSRETVAVEAEQASRDRLAELAAQKAQVEARRAEVEKAERELEARTEQIKEARKALGSRELEIQAWNTDRAAREEKLAARAKELEVAAREAETRASKLSAESSRLAKVDSDLQARATELAQRLAAIEARTGELAAREKAFTRQEASVRAREEVLPTLEERLAVRESSLSAKEVELREAMQAIERTRSDLQAHTAKVDEDLRAAVAVRGEAETVRDAAQKAKLESDAQQQELSKTMKFLQKKALEVLDQEDRMRKREEALAEKEGILESRFEVVENQMKALEIGEEETKATIDRLRAEAGALRAQIASAPAGGPTPADLEEAKQDIENRLKIIQRKAMELLDREERVRTKEEDLRAEAERLGLKI